ncbi:MAG: hypothetical protein Fur0016_29590 [Anaerolineales bacterium]
MPDNLNMDYFFPELSDDGENIPLPPEEMRFLELRAEPVRDDGPLRARVYIEVTPFRKRPHIDIALTDAHGEEIASVNIVEPMQRKNVITIHIRGQQTSGPFCLHARLYYPEGPQSDTAEYPFEL